MIFIKAWNKIMGRKNNEEKKIIVSEFIGFEKIIGFDFKDKKNVVLAFTHKSFANENKKKGINNYNERLEFLGDAILEFLITRLLFFGFEEKDEGELTAIRSALVSREALADTAKKIKIGDFLLLSQGERKSGGAEKDYILANTVEAVIGAIFVDSGIKYANKFVKKFVFSRLKKVLNENLHIDAKSYFQETAQRLEGQTPHYKVIKSEGPDHQKIFTSGIYLEDKLIAKGKGSSRQNSEIDAAKNAICKKEWNKGNIDKK